MGFYRVRISKQVNGKEAIPARYNTSTTLGIEVAPDAYRFRGPMSFALKTGREGPGNDKA